MKEWKIEELLDECEELQRHPYSYDFSQMPSGICNGHRVDPCEFSLAAVIIDRGIVNLGVINERYPKGSVTFVVNNQDMTGREYLRWMLERSRT